MSPSSQRKIGATKTRNRKSRRKVASDQKDDVVTLFLRALPHTGFEGFEGLVSHLLEAQLGQRFRLAASGFQAGMDAETEPGPTGSNRIKVETKHYFKSALDLRELTAEIYQACKDDGCDLWVLACTCPISSQHASALEQAAASEGIECVFLDRPGTGVDRVAAMMASHEDSVLHWASQSSVVFNEAELRQSLAELRNRPEYPAVLARLATKLSGSLVGYSDTVRRAREEHIRILSDERSSEAAYNQNVALLAKSTHRVRRSGIESSLEAWWRKGIPASPHFAILGEEGQGKTWATMGWLSDHIKTDRLPLFLACNGSVNIRPGDTLEALLPKLLHHWTRLKAEDWWKKRLEHWVQRPTSSGPVILVLVDGLNENANVNWIDFFRSMQDEKWRGRVAVIATDRPGHWDGCARLLQDGFHPLTIQGYSNAELQEALKAHQEIDLKKIPDGLLPLLSTPRYCELVAEHFSELEASGDFTPERLVLLDAAHRQSKRRGFPFTESQLINVIQGLASRYRETNTLDLRSIANLSQDIGDSRQIQQEIIDGGLLIRIEGGVGSRYRVEKSRLVFGLGMLLVDNLRETASDGATTSTIAEDIASWLEPHAEMDLKVEISAAAVYHSYLDASFPAIARRALIKHWLLSRNAHLNLDEVRLAIVLKGPEDFLSVAEDFWGFNNRFEAAQDFLGEALCRNRDIDPLRPHLIRSVCRWMGFAHPAGHRLFLGRDEIAVRKAVAEIAARAGHELREGPLTFLGESLTIVEDESLLRLSRLGLRIISAGSRAPFVPGLFAWAAASALMGHALEYDEVAWILRLAEEDLDSLILPAAQRLLSSDDVNAHLAARLLTDALGTAAAHATRKLYPKAEDAERLKRLAEHKANPCESYYSWSDEECEQCLAEAKQPTQMLMNRANLPLLNPNRPTHSLIAEHVQQRLHQIRPNTQRTGMSHTSDDYLLEQIFPLAAAQAPDALARWIRSLIRHMPLRAIEAQRQLAIELPRYCILMEKRETKALKTVLSALRADSADWKPDGIAHNFHQQTEAYSTWALLSMLNPQEAYDEVIDRPSHAIDLDSLSLWFGKLESSCVNTAFEELIQSTDEQATIRTLWLLGNSQVMLSETQRQYLQTLWDHKNATVRGMVARCAVLLEDKSLGIVLVEAERRVDSETPRWEAYWLTQLLRVYSAHIPLDRVLVRVDAAVASTLMVARPHDDAEVTLYAACLDQMWKSVIGADEPTHVTLLPEINFDPVSSKDPNMLPDIREERGRGWAYKDSSLSWKETDEGLPPTRGDPEAEFDALIIERHSRQEAVIAAWRTKALQCFGKPFSVKTLKEVSIARPDLCRQWITAATQLGIAGKRVRARMGSFLVCLCEALFASDQKSAVSLLKDYMVHDSFIKFDYAAMLFRLPRSKIVDAARYDILDGIRNDIDLAHFTRLAQKAKDGWLDEAISSFVDSSFLARKAIGLCIASFSDSSEAVLEAWIARASVETTWIEKEVLKPLRRRHRRNIYASTWFNRFLNERNKDRSWAAFEIAIHLADERWYLWEQIPHNERSNLQKRRIKFMEMNWQRATNGLERKSERNDHFLGIKVPSGEIFPF